MDELAHVAWTGSYNNGGRFLLSSMSILLSDQLWIEPEWVVGIWHWCAGYYVTLDMIMWRFFAWYVGRRGMTIKSLALQVFTWEEGSWWWDKTIRRGPFITPAKTLLVLQIYAVRIVMWVAMKSRITMCTNMLCCMRASISGLVEFSPWPVGVLSWLQL